MEVGGTASCGGQKGETSFERDVVNIIIITVRDKVPHIPSGCVIMQRICLAYMSA